MPKPLRVCLLNEFFYPDRLTGTGNVVTDLAVRLQKQGYEVSAVCARLSYIGKEKPPRSEEWSGVKIRRVFEPNWNRKGTALRTVGNLVFVLGVTLRLVFSRKPDAILVTTAPPFLPMAARVMRALRGVPYVYCIYDLEPDRVLGLGVMGESSLFVRLMRGFQRKALRKAAKVMVIGRCMADRVGRGYGIPSEQIAFVPVGADVEGLATAQLPASPRESFTLAYTGNLGRYHDFDSILDAAKSLHDVRFVIVGKGAQKAHVDERVASEQISNVELKDFLDDAAYAALLSSADACLVTMEKGLEGTCVPSKFYAYMAAGKPTIAVVDPVCEVALEVNEQHCGVAVAQGDAGALAAAIRRLSEDPAEVQSMAANASRAAHEVYSRAQSAQSVANLFRDITR